MLGKHLSKPAMQEHSHQQRTSMGKLIPKGMRGIFGIPKLEVTRDKPGRSDSSSSRNKASNIQAEAINTASRTVTGNHGLTTATGIENQAQGASQSRSHEAETENNALEPTIDLETTDVEFSGPVGGPAEQEIGALTIMAESPALEPMDNHNTIQIQPHLEWVVNTDYSEPNKHPLPQPVAEIPADYSNVLWDEAYDEVRREYPDMVTWYEQTLSTKLERVGEEGITPSALSSSDPFKSHISQTDRETRRTQMKELLESWLGEGDEEEESEDSDEDDDGTGEEVGAITSQKILRKAIEAVKPNALLAWVGICFASRVLLNPKPSNKEDRLGLIHVISRMDWYGRLPRLLSQGTDADNEQGQLRRRIVHLYRAILSYEMNILCSHGGTLAFSFPSGIYKPHEPNSISLETITRAEETLPIFNEELVHLPLMKQMSLSEETTARLRIDDSSESEVELDGSSDGSTDGSSEHVNEMLQDLHVDDLWPSVLGGEDDQAMQDLYGSLHVTKEYKDICNWEQKDNTLLWIRGAAGQGKTMLMKSIIQAISKIPRNDSTSQCISFFLFDSCSSNANNAAAALRNLTKSILVRQRSLADHLDHKRVTTDRTTFDDPNDFPALSGILYDIIRDPEFPETYFIVDALDECSSEVGRPGLMDLVKFIQDSIESSGRIRWIVSSDFSNAIQLAFNKTTQCVTVDMSSLSCSNAADNYIRNKVGVLAEAKGYDEDLKSIIVAALCKRSPSNYLQVNLICEALKSEEEWYVESVLDEVKALNDLSPLYEHFKNKLDCLPRHDGAYCFKILSTLAVLNRSLNLSELEGLVGLGPRVNLRSIIEKCNCFLGASKDGVVSFHHLTARNYMREQVQPVSQAYSDLIQHSIDSLVRVLTRDTLEEYSAINSSLLLGWIGYLYEMINEIVASSEAGQTYKIDPKAMENVLSFLEEHFMVWLEALSLGNQLARATILLRKVDLLLNAKVDETNMFNAAIREAHLIVNLHMSTETPKHTSASNTMLYRPAEGILKIRSFRDEFPQVEVLQLGNKAWGRGFGSLKGHTDWTRSVAFSRDGRLIASGSDDSSVRIWDAETWATQHMLKIEKGWVYIVAFSSKGHIAAGSDEGSITIWDSSLGRELYRLESHISRLRALAFSPDARYLAAASLRGLRIWDFNSQPEKSYDIEHPDGYIWSVSFSSDGRLLASGSNDNKIRIWDSWRDVNSDKSPLILSGHTDEVNSLAFSPEKRPGYLASGSDDGTTKIWAFDKEEPQCILTLVSGGPVDSISFSPDGLRLAFAVNSNTIEIWDVTVGDKLETMRATNDSSITSVAFSPTGASIASTSRDCRVHLWYTTNKNATKEACTQLPTIKEPVSELTVAPNGQTIATGHEDGEVILWNMNDEDVVPTQMPFPHSRRVYCLAFSPDGLSLASGSSDCGVRIYDVATRVKLADFVDHDDYVRSVAWSPEGKYLASGSDDRSVCIYQVDDQTKGWKKAQVVIHGEEYGDYVRAVAFSPNEAKLYLAAGGDNGKVVVWRQAEDKWVPHYAIDAHPDYVRSIVFTPDGGRIVSVGDDSTLRIWDFETKNSVGETIKTRVAHPRMRFEKGWETSGYVITGIGAQSIDPSIKTLPDWCPYGYEEAEEEDGERWITRSGKRVIFIPRIFSPNATYFMGNKVIMGMRTGSVMVFRFSEKEPSRVH